MQLDVLEMTQVKLARSVKRIEGTTSVSVLDEASAQTDTSEMASLKKTLRTKERHLKALQAKEASAASTRKFPAASAGLPGS